MSLKLNVEGDWEFCFDPNNTGLEKGWHKKIPAQTTTINIPHVWHLEPDVGKSSVAFYFKVLDISKDESPKRFFIRFDSVHHYSTIWLNGEQLGTHMGGHFPFDMNASNIVKPGESNLLVVRVEAPNEAGRLGDRSVLELPVGAIYKVSPFAGILGDIHLLMGGRAGIQSIMAFPDYEADRITFESKFWNPKNYKAELEYILTDPSGETGVMPKFVKLEKENGAHNITFLLDKIKTWSPNAPNIYKLKLNLLGSYAMEISFGIRRVEMERSCLKINHEIKKIRGICFTQSFPFTHAIPPFRHSAEKELKNIKDLGFNLIRTGGVPFNNLLLDICDRIGLMVIQETTCFNQKSSRIGLEELKSQMRSLMQFTGYHPSIVAWGVGAENGSMALENGNKLLRFASEIDPYRPIISNFNSVMMDSNGLGKIDLGKVYNPTEAKIEPFGSHKLKVAIPISSSTQGLLTNYFTSKDAKSINDGIHGDKSFWERYNYLKEEITGKILVDGIGAGTPFYLEEIFNNPLFKKNSNQLEARHLLELNSQLESALTELKIVTKTKSFFKEANAICEEGIMRHLESIYINTQFSGYIYETWADMGLNFNGLVDFFRRPKPIQNLIRKMNQKIIIMSETEIRTPYMGTSAAMMIYLLNEENLGNYGLLVRVKGPNGRIWHQESMPGKALPGLNAIGRFKFPVGMEKGWFTFDLTLSKGKKEIAKKEEVFFVPSEVNLDNLLKNICFSGNFPKSITFPSNENASIIVAKNLRRQKKDALEALLRRAEKGATLIIGAITPDDASALNQLNRLPFKVSCFRSLWQKLGSFHYARKCQEFKDLPSNRLLNQAFSDVLPVWSLEPLPGVRPVSGSINFLNSSLGAPKIKLGANIFKVKHGNGVIVFYQLDIFSLLGKNALADKLFYNLITSCQKKD